MTGLELRRESGDVAQRMLVTSCQEGGEEECSVKICGCYKRGQDVDGVKKKRQEIV